MQNSSSHFNSFESITNLTLFLRIAYICINMFDSNLSYWGIAAVGFLAQGLFGVRMAVQWIMSEKAGKLVAPSIFWVFSVLGGFTMFLYGVLRHDFSIILGQAIS